MYFYFHVVAWQDQECERTNTMTSIFIDEMNAEPDTLTPLNITPTRHSTSFIVSRLQSRLREDRVDTGQDWTGLF